jgi:hypothetical protein
MAASAVIRLRRDTAANWTSNNPILALGEMGVETDSRKFKIGDGASTWTALLYGSAVASISSGDVTTALGYTPADNAALAGKEPTIAAGTSGQYWRGDKTWQTLNKAAVGLGSVDNTSDALKNVLSATKLTTARNINGVAFDGTGNITINAVDATARVPTTRLLSTTAPIAGGGDLSADRTLSLSGTKAQFNTACSDGDFLYVGDITQYTDEMAQDAVGGALTDTATIDFTYDDVGAAITADVKPASVGTTQLTDAGVTLAKQADMATASVVYRKTAGAGPPEVNTLATLKTDLGLTGTNSGDQTSIVGITGTKAQFNTAVTDGDILYVGDVTQYTDELAQDAIGAMIDGSLTYVDATPLLQRAALTGDVTASAGSNTTTIANSAVTLAKMADMATSSLIYRKTAGAGAPEVNTLATLKTDLGLTGTNSGDQTITLTSDVTGSGTGSFATTIAAGAVTLAKMANMATGSLIYRKTAGAGAPEVNTLATLKTDLGLTGTNSGDQTSIVGITGTVAQFNTAITDGDLATAARLINTTAPITGGGDLSADRTIAISAATTGAAGSMSAADKTKVDALLSAVSYGSTGSALGPTIADYFTSTISLEASSTYEITCHAYFLKSTAGTVIFQWNFSSAPIVSSSRYQSTPVTGFTTSVITGAEVFAEATIEASTTCIHAATASLTTAVRHSFFFTLLVRTNAATTLQLRATESAGTITPQAGSYMKAQKVI